VQGSIVEKVEDSRWAFPKGNLDYGAWETRASGCCVSLPGRPWIRWKDRISKR
jgi:hypothetical protein